MSNDLADLIKRAEGLQHFGQPVQLACKAMSSDFIDAKLVLSKWSDLRFACEAIVERVQKASISFDYVGGLTMGADALAVGIAVVADCNWFSVRKQPKKRGTKRIIEGARIQEGSRVLLVDDVVTTGGSAEKAYNTILDSGATVVAAVTLVDRGDCARERFEELGVPYFPMVTYADLEIQPVIPPRLAIA